MQVHLKNITYMGLMNKREVRTWFGFTNIGKYIKKNYNVFHQTNDNIRRMRKRSN